MSKLIDVIAVKQSQYFKERKESLRVGEALVNMDFAENYSYVIQNEIQEYHWTSNGCTVHPVACNYKKKIFDRWKWNQTSIVVLFIWRVRSWGAHGIYSPEKSCVLFKRIDWRPLFSRSTSQMAVQKSIKTLSHFQMLYIMRMIVVFHTEWIFLLTAHEKSACDGIGGSIKRRTSHESLRLRQPASNPILNANDMTEYCKVQGCVS